MKTNNRMQLKGKQNKRTRVILNEKRHKEEKRQQENRM